MPRNKRVLVTAGPTLEAIEPVRFISNRSTGEMGYAFARVARRLGFNATLISGPTQLRPPRGVRFLTVTSAADLKLKLVKAFPRCDILIMSAAVADYRPASVFPSKIKRTKALALRLIPTPDILKGLAKKKGKRVVVGFSLETNNPIVNAKKKLRDKKLDYIVANLLSPGRNPFGKTRTTVTVIDKSPKAVTLRNVTKEAIARYVFRQIKNSKIAYSV
ncbi:MAG: phosphopantothenoylcysteine decarboxylase [Candidatus Omnitrophica bacterium]|nr:phosphopantothenoylcysteine decarboxylase [Candidatus Omnitrophota bacterium]